MRNGFTISELLGTIAVLAIIMTIAIPSVIGIQSRIQTDMYCKKIEGIESAASLYAQGIMNELKDETEAKKITVLELVELKFLDKERAETPFIIDPRNKKSLDDNIIEIYLNGRLVSANYMDKDPICN